MGIKPEFIKNEYNCIKASFLYRNIIYIRILRFGLSWKPANIQLHCFPTLSLVFKPQNIPQIAHKLLQR